ncbi:MAG: 50S ribosomal protein L32 [Gemmatimonadetes bacterium]|nr:50S ribosomal protein L32 [Gemmatimonadota bacterium]
MAVPKRRTSKSKKRMRRAHYFAELPKLAPCPRCEELRVPHRVCPTCGYYRGEKRLEIKDD